MFIHTSLLLLVSYLHICESIKAPAWKHCIKSLHALPKEWLLLESPGFPHGMSSQMQCTWVISSNPKTRIRLAFQNFNLTGSTNNCYTQYIEIFDLKKQASMGKMCGTRRAGDFVSFGNEMRIDLLADTANSPHQGFQLRYKQTSIKDRAGFQKKFSFPNGGAKKQKRKKAPAAKAPVKSNKPKTPWANSSNGGKISFSSLKYGTKRKIKPKVKTPLQDFSSNITGNSSSVQNYTMPVTVRRTIRRTTTRRPLPPPTVQYIPPQMGETSDKDEVSLYFVIGISVGGFLFILFFIFLVKICFFPSGKKKKEAELYANCPPKSPLKTDPDAFKKSLNINNLQQLPVASVNDKRHYDVINSGTKEEEDGRWRRRKRWEADNKLRMNESERQTNLPRRDRGTSASSGRRSSGRLPSGDDVSITQSYVIDRQNIKTCAPSRSGQAKPPTLKRKLAQWEKDQLKIASRRMHK